MNRLLVFTWLGFLSVSFALAQSFTYQGYLREGGVPANGAFNLTFKLFNAASGGVQVGSTITLDGTGVANGLFTVELNFGATAFTGADRWLEMAVNGTTLTPRVKITAAPYASFSQNTRGITVDGSNNVGLGTATPSARLDVVGTARVSAFRMTTGAAAGRVLTSDATGMGTWQNAPGLTLPFSGTGIAFPGEAVFKITNSSSGYALLGQSDGNGIGVAGLSTTTVGVNKGVYGMSASASGTGVYGEVPSTTGSTYGGFFTSASQTGFGVYGVSTATTGVAHGGSFWSQSTNGIGVNGYVSAPTGITVGGLFQSDSVNGYGLISNAMATSGTTYAGYFYNTSSGGTAVYGKATATTGNTFGGFFESDSSTGTGVLTRTGQAGAIALHAINTAGGTAARFSGNISVTGNVGIGTTTPISSLHIAAPIPILTIQDSDGSSDQAGYISFQDNAGTERGYIGYGSTTTPHAYFMNNRVGGNIILGTIGNNPRLTVLSNGNVGIGTSSPQSPLHVKGNFGVFNVEGTDHCYIQFYPNGFAAGRKAHLGFPSAGSTDIVLANQTGGAFLSVGNSGGVGIGTRTPNRRLTVWDTLSVEASPGFMPILGIPRPGNVAYRVAMFIDPSGDGVVSGDRKSFREVNPDDPTTDIWYVSLEGPEAAMYVRGTATLVNGRAVIALPAHFRSLASEKGMTVQLTPLSAESKGLAAVRKSLNGVEVVELASGSGNYEFDWEVKAVRKKYEEYQVVLPWDEYMPSGEDRDRAWKERLQAIQEQQQKEVWRNKQ
ncbi:MAG: hypothetical protein KIT45_13090 [Fimbriimonadia bacterium]|nr:hypothetical protein [Fimbriimonadia bacterium]